jgi:hypothetical protein
VTARGRPGPWSRAKVSTSSVQLLLLDRCLSRTRTSSQASVLFLWAACLCGSTLQGGPDFDEVSPHEDPRDAAPACVLWGGWCMERQLVFGLRHLATGLTCKRKGARLSYVAMLAYFVTRGRSCDAAFVSDTTRSFMPTPTVFARPSTVVHMVHADLSILPGHMADQSMH